jgi:hypothetical protein
VESDGSLIEVQDNMLELHRRMKSLQELISVLESGFEAINDDNCTYVISSFKVVEEQLSTMRSDLLKSIDALASIIEAKGV